MKYGENKLTGYVILFENWRRLTLSKREEDYIALLLFIRRRENILIYEILCGCQSLLL